MTTTNDPTPGTPMPPPLPARCGCETRRTSCFGWFMRFALCAMLLFGGMVLLTIVTTIGTCLENLNGLGSANTLGGKPFQEEHVQGEGTAKIVIVPVRGLIMDEPDAYLFGSGKSIVELTIEQLRQAARDPDVKGIVLEVDSPGGGVTASDVIHNEVVKCQQAAPKKIVVVHMGDVCASGGYYISASADCIVASPTTITGSIGVIASLIDASQLLHDKLGIRNNTVKSGEFKDMGSMMRPMTPEDRAIWQNLIDTMYGRFVDLVAEGRKGRGPVPKDADPARAAIRKIADGRIYTANEAVANGLVDALGYREDAIKKCIELAGLTEADAKVIRYKRSLGLISLLEGRSSGGINMNAGIQVDAGDLVRRATPRLEYRWVPGMD